VGRLFYDKRVYRFMVAAILLAYVRDTEVEISTTHLIDLVCASAVPTHNLVPLSVLASREVSGKRLSLS
jgi:hypothetical protein